MMMRYHLSALSTESTNSKCWRAMEKREPSYTAMGMKTAKSHHGECDRCGFTNRNKRPTMRQFIPRNNAETPSFKRHVHPNIHWDTVYNRKGCKRPKTTATQKLIQKVSYIHTMDY